MKAICFGCGDDCSHAYATHKGYPYHVGCLPVPAKKGPCPPHEWEIGNDGWGVILGVSKCKRCGAIATEARMKVAS